MGEFGVGMPASLKLDAFADHLTAAFDATPYLVGSATTSSSWRDVDVRVMLEDEEYNRRFGDPNHPFSSPEWVALVLAFSALGTEMTGLPIDFQIQQRTHANERHGTKPRHANERHGTKPRHALWGLRGWFELAQSEKT